MSVVYHILNWQEHFENNKSKERDRCSFVCVPNKQHGIGLFMVLSQPEGLEIYGIWQLMIGAASRQRRHRDGWLTDDGHRTGTAWTPSDMAMLWRCSPSKIERAIEVLSSPRVGWMEAVSVVEVVDNEQKEPQCPPSARRVPAECPSGVLEGKGIEGNGKEPPSPQGGDGIDEAEKASKDRAKRIPTNPQAIRISKMFHRGPTTPWDVAEIRAFTKVRPLDEEDLEIIEKYYAANRDEPNNICRTGIAALLNNWQCENSRARAWAQRKPTDRKEPDPQEAFEFATELGLPESELDAWHDNQARFGWGKCSWKSSLSDWARDYKSKNKTDSQSCMNRQ